MSATKFTPENRGALLEHFAAGLWARAVDVRPATVKDWIGRGRREDGTDYAEFARRVDEARDAAAERPDPMDSDELAIVVSQMARKGSVRAAKLRWEMLSGFEEPDEAPADEFDEPRERRRRRVA